MSAAKADAPQNVAAATPAIRNFFIRLLPLDSAKPGAKPTRPPPPRL
jgi:hypothetical protein